MSERVEVFPDIMLHSEKMNFGHWLCLRKSDYHRPLRTKIENWSWNSNKASGNYFQACTVFTLNTKSSESIEYLNRIHTCMGVKQ